MSKQAKSSKASRSKQNSAPTGSTGQSSVSVPAQAPEPVQDCNSVQPDCTSSPNTDTDNVQPRELEPVEPRIKNFGEVMVGNLVPTLQSYGWIALSIIPLLIMISQNGFKETMIQMLEILLLEIDEKYDLYHAEKDFVCIATNVSQIVAKMLFGDNREIYAKFNGLKLLRKASVIVGKSKTVKKDVDIYTLDSSRIDLYNVDLLQRYKDNKKHYMEKIENNQELPFKLHLKFCNNQSMDNSSNPRLKAQQTISNKYIQNIEKFLFTTLMTSISTHNKTDRNEGIKEPVVDMTHEVIFDYILENLNDLKELYCYLFRHLRLGFVKARDVRERERDACYTIGDEKYYLVCYNYEDSIYKASTSNDKYRLKMKNFMKAENINYDPNDLNNSYGAADVTPDGLFYKVATLDEVKTEKIENFVTKDLSSEHKVLNLRDVSDPLNSFYGFPENLKVQFGSETLQVKLADMDFFENKYTERENASVTCPGFKLNNYDYVDLDNALKYILRFNDKAYAKVRANIDESKIEGLCKDALEHNDKFALFDWGQQNYISILENEPLKEVEVIGGPDYMADLIMKANPDRYEKDKKDLKDYIEDKNITEVSNTLERIATKLFEDLEEMDYKLDEELTKLEPQFIKKCLLKAIAYHKQESDVFIEDWFKFWIKALTLEKLIYKDEIKVYNYFKIIDTKLFKAFKINSDSKIEDYQREFLNYNEENEEDNIEAVISRINKFFSFRDNFSEFDGYDKLFKKLVYD